jgi:hypothetical protein
MDPSFSNPPESPELLFDDSQVHSVRHPNFCNVTQAPGEVTLLFGNGRKRRGEVGKVDVNLREQVILTPIAAKVLGEMIASTVRDYEAEHGPLGVHYEPTEPAPTVVLAAAPSPERPPLPTDQDMAAKASLLLELIETLQVQYGFERSFKVFDRTLLKNRFLLGINKALVTPQVRTRLPMICKRLGIPEPFLREFQEQLPNAEFVHFGFEETESSAIFKVYLEFSQDLRASIATSPEAPSPVLLDLGYKWDVRDNTTRALARYTALPGLSLEAIGERLSAILFGPTHERTLSLAQAIIDVAASRITHRNLLYLEVAEEGNPRVSFDLNFYAAKLRIAELLPVLLQICRHYSIPAADFQPLYAESQEKTFGHLSGGIDREGRDFLTLYFGVEGRSHELPLL